MVFSCGFEKGRGDKHRKCSSKALSAGKCRETLASFRMNRLSGAIIAVALDGLAPKGLLIKAPLMRRTVNGRLPGQSF
jgi:hypothetical protein